MSDDAASVPASVLVTGMSGAGRTQALKALEDVGFEALDNLPITLIAPALAQAAPDRPVALGVDIRTRGFDPKALAEIAGRETQARKLALLFIDADDDVLARRFTETRRGHPFAADRPVADGLAYERRLLADLRDAADLVLDSSQLSPHELRRIVQENFARSAETLAIFVTSFSFKRGVPREADLVFDTRFLRNPHYAPALRPLTGRNPKVDAFVTADPGFWEFFGHLTALIGPLLPRYRAEGKRYLTVAIGCTGGKHRSVATAERLARWLGDGGWRCGLYHRDAPPDPEKP